MSVKKGKALSQNLTQAAMACAKDNLWETMEQLLAHGVSPNAANGIGQTSLHVASIWGHVEVATVLLTAGANVNAQNQFGMAPLHAAAQSSAPGAERVAELLMDWGADPQIEASNGMKPFEVAKTDEMRVICGAPPLKGHAALRDGDTAALEALLAEGAAEVSEQDTDGDTLLHLAVKAALGDDISDEPMIEEVDRQLQQMLPPGLVLGSRSSSAPAVASPASLDLLLKHAKSRGLAAAQRLHNSAGLLPLHIAAGRSDLTICEALLRAGAPVDACTVGKGELHAHLAEDAGEEATLDASLVHLLLRYGANPNVADLELQTPLHVAILGGMHEVAAALLEAKADVTVGCKAFGANNTALHQATILRDARMIALLARAGADVNARGRDGWTPLGLAVRSGAVDTAKALLAAKADPHLACGNGKTPIDIASVNNKKGLLELLNAQAAG